MSDRSENRGRWSNDPHCQMRCGANSPAIHLHDSMELPPRRPKALVEFALSVRLAATQEGYRLPPDRLSCLVPRSSVYQPALARHGHVESRRPVRSPRPDRSPTLTRPDRTVAAPCPGSAIRAPSASFRPPSSEPGGASVRVWRWGAFRCSGCPGWAEWYSFRNSCCSSGEEVADGEDGIDVSGRQRRCIRRIGDLGDEGSCGCR